MSIIPNVIGAFIAVTKGLLKGLKDLEVEGEWRPSKLQRYWERQVYSEESWRLEETCGHSNSSKWSSAKADVKNSQGVNNNRNNTDDNIEKSLDLVRGTCGWRLNKK